MKIKGSEGMEAEKRMSRKDLHSPYLQNVRECCEFFAVHTDRQHMSKVFNLSWRNQMRTPTYKQQRTKNRPYPSERVEVI